MQLLIDAIFNESLNIDQLRAWLEAAPVQLGFQAINPAIVIWHDPVLVGQILLAESHINVHLIPHLHRGFIDIFTCGALDNDKILELLKEFNFEDIKITIIERGLEYQ